MLAGFFPVSNRDGTARVAIGISVGIVIVMNVCIDSSA